MDIKERLDSALSDSRFQLVDLQRDAYLIKLRDIPTQQQFSVFCDEEWRPLFLEPDSSEGALPLREWSDTITVHLQENKLSIEKLLEDGRDLLQTIAPDTRAPQLSTPPTHPTTDLSSMESERTQNNTPLPRPTPAQRQDRSFYQPPVQPDIFSMEEEQEVTPTVEDWQRTIIPNLRMFLVDHEHQL